MNEEIKKTKLYKDLAKLSVDIADFQERTAWFSDPEMDQIIYIFNDAANRIPAPNSSDD